MMQVHANNRGEGTRRAPGCRRRVDAVPRDVGTIRLVFGVVAASALAGALVRFVYHYALFTEVLARYLTL